MRLRLTHPAVVFVACVVPTLLLACPPAEQSPCFPAASSSVNDDQIAADGGIKRETLMWELDKLPALHDAPERDPRAPPSEVFIRAQRDMKTEFWMEALRDLLIVVRGDTSDGRRLRQIAQFDLAIALFRLHYYGESKQVFSVIAGDSKHPMHGDGVDWMSRRICGS